MSAAVVPGKYKRHWLQRGISHIGGSFKYSQSSRQVLSALVEEHQQSVWRTAGSAVGQSIGSSLKTIVGTAVVVVSLVLVLLCLKAARHGVLGGDQ